MDLWYYCPVCEDAIYQGLPFGGYCDQSFACAGDEGASLVALSPEQGRALLEELLDRDCAE